MGVEQVYDQLAEEYLSPKHKTVWEFNQIQREPIKNAVHRFLEVKGIEPLECKVLIIGGGPGQHVLDLADFSDLNRIPFYNFVEVDISKNMLEKANQNYRAYQQAANRNEELPTQIHSEAISFLQQLATPKKEFYQLAIKLRMQPEDLKNFVSFYKKPGPHIVIAGLCDHINEQDFLFEYVTQVLNEDGLFIASYPHSELMKVVRRDIYGIDEHTTRFKLPDGTYATIPSFPQDEKSVKDFFPADFFSESKLLFPSENTQSSTIKKANEIAGRTLPAIVLGTGTKLDYLERRGYIPLTTIASCHSLS